MALLLGIDTGGTFTDAALWDEGQARVVAKAKALTTPRDLSLGIGEAARGALAGTDPGAVAQVSLSTTLATNALVEGRGGRVALVFLGFDERDAARAGLAEALDGGPLILAPGGHRSDGGERAKLDLDALAPRIEAAAREVEAFAVTAIFGGRDPAHEVAVAELIRARTGLPVTCGHQLSDALHGPRNALTAVLNARLIAPLAELLEASRASLTALGVAAPLTMVRGDGSLVSAAFAAERPIETILSGPAASLVGARALTGLDEAVVADIGGTTLDVGLLRGGRPKLAGDGATVGGHRTMIRAVDMAVHGLGGDSEVALEGDGFALGPRRAVPLSLLAREAPGLVRAALERQASHPRTEELHARFLVPVRAAPAPFDAVVAADRFPDRASMREVARLVSRGVLRVAAFTPTDAAHVLGLHDAWDRGAAEEAATLLARAKDRFGRPLAADAQAFARLVLARLVERGGEALLASLLAADGLDPGLAASPLARAAMAGEGGAARLRVGSNLPLIGLGASAATHLSGVASRLGCDAVLPPDADVANAVGAVAGRIVVERSVAVSGAGEGAYRVHLPEGAVTLAEEEAARAAAEASLRATLAEAAREAGAGSPTLSFAWEVSAPEVEGRRMFVEGRLTGRAVGRPGA